MKKKNLLFIFLLVLVALFTLSACKQGEQGIKGETGDQGAKGESGDAGDKGETGDTGDPGEDGDKGQDAKEPEFQVTEEGIQWRLAGEEEWHTLISINDLIGYSNKYTISFDANGGDEVQALEKQIFKTEATLPTPTRKGYTFAYWTDAEGNKVETYTVLGDATLKAVWGSTIEISNQIYGSSFDVTGLTEVSSFNLGKFNAGADGKTNNLATKDKIGSGMGTYWSRLFLKAIDANNGIYEIVGRLTSGKANATFTDDYDLAIGGYQDASADDYKAINDLVTAEASPVGLIVKITGLDLNAAAGELKMSVKVYNNTKNTQLVIEGNKFTLATPTLEGRTFIGWTTDGINIVNGEITPTGDTKYQPIYNYTVKFNTNGGNEIADKVVAQISDYEAALPTPTKAEVEFNGWYLDSEFTQKVTSLPLHDVTLYAKYDAPTVVTYRINGGNWTHTQTVTTYADIAAVQKALLDEYNAYKGTSKTAAEVAAISIWNTDIRDFLAANNNEKALEWAWFIDWAAENELADNKTSCQGYASNNYTIKNAGHDNYGITYVFRAFIGSTVIRSGHASWGTLTYNDATLAEVWAYYQSTFADKTATYLDEFEALPTPIKEGYTFVGWFDAEGKAVTKIEKATAPTTLTLDAIYTPNNTLVSASACEGKADGDVVKIDTEYYLIGTNLFATIDAALAKADTIKLAAGTYGATTISKANVTIKGGTDVIFNNIITISAEGVTIDGIKLVEEGQIIASANKITLKNLTNDESKSPYDGSTGLIAINANISDFSLEMNRQLLISSLKIVH